MRLPSIGQARILDSLHYHDFRWVFVGSFASFMGMSMVLITQAWLVVTLSDDSPIALSMSIVTITAPMTMFSLLGGALADRVSRRLLVIVGQSGSAIMMFLMATLNATDVITLWQVLGISLMNGSLMAFSMPSRQAMISDIVPQNRLMNAISLNNSSMNLTRILGYAIAGFLILFVGTSGVFYLISLVYIFSALSMFKVQAGTKPSTNSGKGLTTDIHEGMTYVFNDKTLFGLVIMMFIPALFGYSYYALLPAWGREALNINSDDLGLMMMLMGVGALIGTLILASMHSFNRRGIFLLGFCLLWGIFLAVFAKTTSYYYAVPLLMAIGLLNSVFMSLNTTLLQMNAAPEMRGRVMSIAQMSFGAMPLSGVPFGIMAEFTGTPFALMMSGILLVCFTSIFAIIYPHYRRIK